MHTLFLARFAQKTMKHVLFAVEDDCFDKFMGLGEICPGVEVLAVNEVAETRTTVDLCVAMAINELCDRHVLRRAYDYTYIMLVINQENLDRHLFFASPQDYIGYLAMLDVDRIPGKTSIYDMISCTRGEYPNWQFSDRSDNVETLRRNNVAKQFLSAYYRARRAILEGFSEK